LSDPHLQSLIFPFQRSARFNGRILCIGLREASAELSRLSGDLTFIQGFRPDYLALESTGYRVLPEICNERFDAALIRLGRHRGQNEQWISEAVQRLAPGSMVVIAGARTEGAASLRKRMAGLVAELQHAAMNHGEVFWFPMPADAEDLARKIRPAPRPPIDGRFHTAPGMFSSDRIDPGSCLLAMNLPADLAGEVADFCAGWGYLSAVVADRFPAVRQLDLYEADFASLVAAKRNVTAREGLDIRFLWQDLAGEAVVARYDAIVSNPPFHVGRRSDPDLGRTILLRAASALKRGGRLLLVANRHLPYEQVLRDHFSGFRQLAGQGGYKVLEARK
jgi:16S rRNA (guanine1207-N2)-methyltransferase